MLAPTVDNIIRDEEKDITYVIKAYRVMNRAEKVLAVRHFYAQKKKPRVKRGQTVIIISSI
jgi:hypothetical protein